MRIDRLVSFLAAAALTAGAAVPIAAQATLVDIGVCVVQEGTLRDELMDQEGWLGPEAGGFGSYTVPADTERLVILYFEPVIDPASVNRLDLVEGDCAEGCWHFYDIRLQDR